jgi:hypothetical protein
MKIARNRELKIFIRKFKGRFRKMCLGFYNEWKNEITLSNDDIYTKDGINYEHFYLTLNHELFHARTPMIVLILTDWLAILIAMLVGGVLFKQSDSLLYYIPSIAMMFGNLVLELLADRFAKKQGNTIARFPLKKN